MISSSEFHFRTPTIDAVAPDAFTFSISAVTELQMHGYVCFILALITIALEQYA